MTNSSTKPSRVPTFAGTRTSLPSVGPSQGAKGTPPAKLGAHFSVGEPMNAGAEPSFVVVEVVEYETDEVIKRFGPMPDGKANRVDAGLQHNLDHSRFYTRIADHDMTTHKGDLGKPE